MSSNLIDIAIELYGNPEAVTILIDDNPGLITDSVDFEITNDINVNDISIRAEYDLMDKKVLKELDGKKIVS